MDIKKISMSISKTYQYRNFEPVKIFVAMECEIEKKDNIEKSCDKLKEMILNEVLDTEIKSRELFEDE